VRYGFLAISSSTHMLPRRGDKVVLSVALLVRPFMNPAHAVVSGYLFAQNRTALQRYPLSSNTNYSVLGSVQ